MFCEVLGGGGGDFYFIINLTFDTYSLYTKQRKKETNKRREKKGER